MKPERSVNGVLAPIVGFSLLLAAFVSAIRDRRRAASDDKRPLGVVAPTDSGDVHARAEATQSGNVITRVKAQLETKPVIGTALRVVKRYGQVHGNNIAAAISFQIFVSLLPLMLVVITVLGFINAGSADVAGKIVGNLGLTGEAATTIREAVSTATENRRAIAPIALLGLLWSGLGLVNAFQYGLDQVWQVEARGIKDKAVGMFWILGAVVLFVASTAVTTALNFVPGFSVPIGIVVGLAVNFALWLWTFDILPNRRVPVRALVPGAIVGAVGMEILKVVGAVYVPRAVASSSALYGSLGVVFAVLAWLLIFSRLVIYASVFNVLRWEDEAGTVRATIEVPGGRDIQPTVDVTRGGRVDKSDVAA